MDDLSSKISEILSDPQALQQIKGLGEMLGLSNSSTKEESVHKADNVSESVGDNMSLNSLSMITKFAPLLSDLNKEDDTTRLLYALRPFLSSKRREKLDEALKFLKLFRLLPLLKDVGILDTLF